MFFINADDGDILQLKRCIEWKNLEAIRYSETTQIYALFHRFLLENPNFGSIYIIERELKRKSDNKALELDLLIKNSDGMFILIEFKSSVRNNNEDIEETIIQMVERDDNFLDNSSDVVIKNLVLICHDDDAKKICDFYKDLVNRGKIKMITRPFSFFTWKISKDTGNIENFYINFYDGAIGNNALLKEIKDKKLKNDTIKTIFYAIEKNFIFTNRKPPLQYTLAQVREYIYQKLNPFLGSPIRKETVKLMTTDIFIKLFIKDKGNEFVKPKQKWLKEALNFFYKELKWLTLDDEIEVIVDKFKIRHQQQNAFKFFSRFFCRRWIQKQKQLKKQKIRLESKLIEMKQKSLGEFISQK